MSVATNMLQEAESDENFMGQIIAGDETWAYRYDPETKRQFSRSKVKFILIVSFDMEGIVHYEYVLQGQTVNQQFYLQVLKRLRLAISHEATETGS